MKQLLHLILLGIFLALTSCNKEIEFTPLAMPTAEDDVVETFEPFNVTTSKATYQVGEQVRFNFTGNTESIDFFSGEKYREYAYKDGRIDLIFHPVISFQLLANPFPSVVKNFQLMVSTDYVPSATPTFADVDKATWTNVAMTLPVIANTWINAGTHDLSRYVVEGKPLYIGFRYVNSFTAATPPVHLNYYWYVRSLVINNKLPNGSNKLMGSQATTVFDQVQEDLVNKGTITVLADRFLLVGNSKAAASTEHWMVSPKFEANEPFQIGGDKPLPIKSQGGSKLLSFSQAYTKPGVYTAHFVVKQKNAEGIVKDILVPVNVNITE